MGAIELEQAEFIRVELAPSLVHQSVPHQPAPNQIWDVVFAGRAFARIEVFEGPNQWGVRVLDQAPALSGGDLVSLVKRMLVWNAGCRTDTVDVVLARDHERHTLVNVGGQYV